MKIRQYENELGKMAELAVEDDGKGIAANMREQVFGRFFKGNESKAGAGLGLAIVRHVANAHGGYAEVQGREGSRVSVTIPVITT